MEKWKRIQDNPYGRFPTMPFLTQIRYRFLIPVYPVLSNAASIQHIFFRRHKITIEIGQIKAKQGTQTKVILVATA